ncbi:MAG: hypothetical protein WA728_09855 [Xanthobacteraceae bacterium]
MDFNRRKMEDERCRVAEKEAAERRATDVQVLEDAERLIAVWNERQAKRMPIIFPPTIGAAITARYWLLWVRCPACRTINAIDLWTLDRHHDVAVTSLIPALSCRSCRRTRRSQNSCAYHGPASPMKSARNIVGECWASKENTAGAVTRLWRQIHATRLRHGQPAVKMNMTQDDDEPEDHSWLLDHDWLEINKLRRACKDGGDKALDNGLVDLLETDAMQFGRIACAFDPNNMPQRFKDLVE